MKRIICFTLIICLSFAAQSFTLFSHRGARGLAPENTIQAIQKALDLKVDAIDIDVVMSKDKQLIVYHDLTLNPDITKDQHGNWVANGIIIKNLTLNQLKTYRTSKIRDESSYSKIFQNQTSTADNEIPTLREVIQHLKKHANYPVILQIELKTDPTTPELSVSADSMANALHEIAISENFTNRLKIQAFDWQCLIALHKLNPHIATGYLTSAENSQSMLHPDPKIASQWTGGYLLKNFKYSIPEMISSLEGTWWDAEDIEINSQQVAKAHQLGLKIAAWSWPEKNSHQDSNSLMLNKLIEMHVDGIITDRPDLVRVAQKNTQ